ncbi:hypothetical protein N7491_009646 [Penicillium cf. griseofulvum]|uniref:Uncharacterized protein n=1 Tax=Penicillium cf. griseofulvum TaxID=2972120 RepID=A0A9W9MEJ8_9EURO|nr:hypothetical protein N7472_004759 [Penicillium cf. griseofulvum]KAJ5424430.1 hypothetical protein N7491_009646 [Penicillium cf. griseofulvum]KAJ5442328.1 hypothetical protein N7445_005335 [Penicillium cf. griseofulvum]
MEAPAPQPPNPPSSTDAEEPLQSPRIHGTNVAPGYWAGKAHEANWKLSKRAILRPGTLLNSMSGMELLREPTKANVEALLAQATGTFFEGNARCYYCKAGCAFFDGCVRVPGNLHCAICHVRERHERCSFNSELRETSNGTKRKAEEGVEENVEEDSPKKAAKHAEGAQDCAVSSQEGLKKLLQSSIEENKALKALWIAADERIRSLQQILGHNILPRV